MRCALRVCTVALVALTASNGFGCGDKFVVFGRGVRFQRAYAAAHPAAILVYSSRSSRIAAAEDRDRLLSVLRLVGHRPHAVTTEEELLAALKSGEFDIVLMDVSESEGVSEKVTHASSRPTIVPLLFNPTREELATIERQNSCAVQFTKRSHELLLVIDDVMKQRLQGASAVCQRKRA